MARPGEEGKLDASGTSHSGNANVAEIYNQVLMMLSHEIFDPEFGKRVLIDQAFIVAGGEITKQALNWARQRTRRLAATVDHLHGPQRHPGLVRSEQPSLARVRALTANLARRPTLLTHAPCLLSGQAIRGVQKTSDIRAGDSRNRHRSEGTPREAVP